MRERLASQLTVTAVSFIVLLAGFSAATRRPVRLAMPLVHRFAVGAASNDIALIASSHTLVIAQGAARRALAADEATGRRLAVMPVLTGVYHVAVDTALRQVYLPDEFKNRMVVVNYGHGWAHLTTIAVGLGRQPHAAAVDPRTHRVFVTNEHGESVSVVDGTAPQRAGEATVHVGLFPGGIGIDAATGLVYVVLVGEDRVVVLNTAGSVLRSIRVGKGPTHLAIDTLTGHAAVVNTTAGTLSIVDGAHGTAAPPLPVGPKPYNVVVDGARGLVFVASATTPQVTVVDSRRGVVRATMRLDMVPGALAIDYQSRQLIVGGANRPWIEIFSYRTL